MLRVSILPPEARSIVAIGRAVFRTIPSDTEKPVTGLVCPKICPLCCAGMRTEATFPPTKRFVGTKTYCVWLTTTGDPAYPEAPKAMVGGRGAQPT